MSKGLNYSAAVVLAFGMAGGWYSMHVKQMMHTRSRYTIGYLMGGTYTPKSGKRYSYNYQVGGKKYEATDGRERNMNQVIGSRFLVEYDSLVPGVSTGHFATAVPDSMRNSPCNGWPTPPIPVLPAE